MLGAIGAGSLEDLFADIPESVRLGREIDLPPGRSEQEVYEHLASLAARNRHAEEEITFLGAGMYDHYVPALIDTLLSRSEFLTPYTPYQPEISQGGLQVMFEFQTAISELTGLPVSNASRVRGAERRRRGGLPRQARDEAAPARGEPRAPPALARGAAHARGRLRDGGGGVAARRRGPTDVEALAAMVDDDTAAVFVQQPNFLGHGRGPRRARRGRQAHRRDARVRRRPDRRCRMLKPPGELGVGPLRGRGPDARQPARLRRAVVRLLRRRRALHPQDAGPDRGRDARRGRPARLRADAPDARAAHPAREGHAQHLHGAGAERAGRRGLPLLARQARLRRAGRAAAAAHALRARGARPRGRSTRGRWCASSPCACPTSTRRSPARARPGINPGYPLRRDFPEYSDGLLVAVTERRTKEHIDRLAERRRRTASRAQVGV